jgi:ribonuclease P protein component
LATIRKRRDFLAANSGKRAAMPGFVLLIRDRKDDDDTIRLGITVTKKIGGAVVRNRMKRRFRALGREILPERGTPGADYVMIGRQGGIERDFSTLRGEFSEALDRISA